MPVLQRYATPLITGFFLISLVSGVALFFHVGPSGFHGMHEWLSMVLIVPFALHVWKNWRPMLAYLNRTPMLATLALSLVAAAIFLIPTGSGETAGGPPQFQLAQRIMDHTVAEVAPVVGSTPQALTDSLVAAGFTLDAPDQSLSAIASASGKSTTDIARVLLAPGS